MWGIILWQYILNDLLVGFIAEKESTNHVAENVKRMRQIQRKCRQKQREEVASAPVPVKALWKSQKYEAVPSRLGEYLHVSPQSTQVRFWAGEWWWLCVQDLQWSLFAVPLLTLRERNFQHLYIEPRSNRMVLDRTRKFWLKSWKS